MSNPKQTSLLKWANVLTFLFMVWLNYLANALPLNGKTTGQLSDQYPNLFVPAGITFSIWALIYLLLAGFIARQFLAGSTERILKANWWFSIQCILNGSWIVAWHFEVLPLSLLIMLGILGALYVINQGFKNNALNWEKATFGIYLGWICIALLANITALWVHYSWFTFGISAPTWTILLLVLGALFSSWLQQKLQNPFLGFSVIWAFLGIILKRHMDYPAIAWTAAILCLMVLLFSISVFRKQAQIRAKG